MSLGNERPGCLSRVERSLWTALLRIASGAALLPELHVFLGSYINILEMYDDENRHNDWFAGRKLPASNSITELTQN